MSTDLERFRDHCRSMSLLDAHRADCHAIQRGHWGDIRRHPDPDCPGCVPDNDRRLFASLALEVDQHLANETGQPQIWQHADATLEGPA